MCALLSIKQTWICPKEIELLDKTKIHQEPATKAGTSYKPQPSTINKKKESGNTTKKSVSKPEKSNKKPLRSAKAKHHQNQSILSGSINETSEEDSDDDDENESDEETDNTSEGVQQSDEEEEEDDNDSESPEEDDEDESVVKESAKLERRMGALDMKKFFAGNLFSASLKEQVY